MMVDSMLIGEMLAKLLVQSGVKHVFGFPGETSLPFYIGMQQTADITHILARCPRCAGYMAESYARISGSVGVCDAPGGIGSPFVAPALHEANNSSTPLLFLASGVDNRKRNRWTTSQCDQQGLFRSITKEVYLLENPNQLEELFHNALQVAISPRTGPVFLEIPANYFSLNSEIISNFVTSSKYPKYRLSPDSYSIQKAIELLKQAKCPLVVAGGGVFLADAMEEVRQFSDYFGVPVATTLNGKGVVNEKHPKSLGVTGSKGSVEVNSFVKNADCILVLGSKLGDKSTNSYAWPRENQNIIHIDIDPKELIHNQGDYFPIFCDIKSFMIQLNNLLSEWRAPSAKLPERNIFWETGSTHQLCQLLSNSLPNDSILVADASVASGWAGAAVTFSGSQRLISPRGSGSIGYALPAAIGVQFAKPNAKVIAIGGDGGLAISMHEMETAARYNLPIIYFLLNNCRLGLIDKHAALLNGNPVSSQFIDMNWCQIARAFGWDAIYIDDPNDLVPLFPKIYSTKKPLLIEYRISEKEIAPDFFIAAKQTEFKK